MIGKFITGLAAIASLTVLTIPATASARDHNGYRDGYSRDRDHGYGERREYRHDRRDYRQDRREYRRDRRHYNRDRGHRYGRDRGYYSGGYYSQQAYGGYGRGYDGRGYYGRGDNRRGYRCGNGTTGTILGAIAGGLIGDSVAGRGDRTLGAVVGAGGGALVGRSIDRNC